jgi:polygalacturonase
MHFFTSLATVALAATSVVAAPASLDARADSCSFSGSSGAANAIKNKKSCSTITLSNLIVPAGTTLDLTNLAKGTNVVFKGTTTFGYKEWKGPLVSISGDHITVDGTGATLDADGSRWWDTKGTNGGKTKPKFFYAHKMTNSVIKGITIKNSPVQVFSINNADTLTVSGVTINNKDGDSKGGHNTDAFDVGDSQHITISGATVYNQDDCLAVNSGTDITFTGGYCSGGHGLSIGSVGGRDNNVVDTVMILDSQIVDSDNGVRIKTVSGATGSVKNVTYKNITLKNIAKNGIVIQQDYENGSPTGKPTTGVPITGLTIDGVKGSVGSKAIPVYILCGKGSCSGWKWSGVSLTGGKKSDKCLNVPSPATC